MGQGSLFGCDRLHVDEQRAEYATRLREGDTDLDEPCPCCTRYVKLYARTMNEQMARFLIRLARLTREKPEGAWHHVRDLMPSRAHKASSDGSYLKHWGFVRAKSRGEVGPRLGLYQITRAGVQFVNGDRDAARQVFVFAGRPWGMSADRTTIHEALGTDFDWWELMGLQRPEGRTG